MKAGYQYKVPEPGTSGTSTTTVDPTVPGTLDSKGFPIGFYTMATSNGNISVYFTENITRVRNYCQDCEKIESATDPKYPQLAKVLPKVKSLIFGNTAMLQYLKLLSGYNDTQLANLLSEESLKKLVRVADISDWGLYEGYITPDIIFVRRNLVASLETGGFKLGEENENLNGTSFFVAMVIVHELVHYGRHMNNLPQMIDGVFEAGQTYEKWVFNRILGIRGVTTLARQYGWHL